MSVSLPVAVLFAFADVQSVTASTYDLIANLDRRAYQPSLVLPIPTIRSRELELVGAPVRYYPVNMESEKLTRYIETMFDDYKIDIVHTSTAAPESVIQVALRRRAPLIVHAGSRHCGIPRVFHLASRVITSSPARANELCVSGVDPSVVECVYDPMDVERIFARRRSHSRALVRKELGIATNASLIAVPDDACSAKRQPHPVLQALPRVLRHVPNAIVAVVGSPRDPSYAAGLHELQARVNFVDLVRARAALAVADVATVCDASETSWRLVIEAFASGCPVVVSRKNPTADLVANGRDGFVLNGTHIDDVASVLTTILTRTSLRHRLSTAAKKKAQSFDLRGYVQRVAHIYAKVTEVARSGTGQNP